MAKIMVAEDERDIRELIALTLKFSGFEVVSASNGAEAVELAGQKGAARVIQLPVSAAFHTPLMQPVVEAMMKILAKPSLADPSIPVIANTTAQPLTTAQAVREELVHQLCNCVQWQHSVEYIVNEGVKTFIEIGPGKVLTGLIKRINREVQTLNIGDVQAVRNCLT